LGVRRRKKRENLPELEKLGGRKKGEDAHKQWFQGRATMLDVETSKLKKAVTKLRDCKEGEPKCLLPYEDWDWRHPHLDH